MYIDNINCVDDAPDTRSNPMNNDLSTSIPPIPTTRLTHYYQGRPNTVFLSRYRTSGTGRTVRPA